MGIEPFRDRIEQRRNAAHQAARQAVAAENEAAATKRAEKLAAYALAREKAAQEKRRKEENIARLAPITAAIQRNTEDIIPYLSKKERIRLRYGDRLLPTLAYERGWVIQDNEAYGVRVEVSSTQFYEEGYFYDYNNWHDGLFLSTHGTIHTTVKNRESFTIKKALGEEEVVQLIQTHFGCEEAETVQCWQDFLLTLPMQVE